MQTTRKVTLPGITFAAFFMGGWAGPYDGGDIDFSGGDNLYGSSFGHQGFSGGEGGFHGGGGH